MTFQFLSEWIWLFTYEKLLVCSPGWPHMCYIPIWVRLLLFIQHFYDLSLSVSEWNFLKKTYSVFLVEIFFHLCLWLLWLFIVVLIILVDCFFLIHSLSYPKDSFRFQMEMEGIQFRLWTSVSFYKMSMCDMHIHDLYFIVLL